MKLSWVSKYNNMADYKKEVKGSSQASSSEKKKNKQQCLHA